MSKDKTTEKPNSDEKKGKNDEEIVGTNQPYSIKKISEGKYSVVSETGETIRVYKEEEGCEDPKECAKMFAKKLSMKKV